MQIIDEPISKTEADALVKWLADPAARIFVRVVESQAFRLECEAAERIVKGSEAAERMATNDVLSAQKTRYALELMREYRAKKVFNTTKATPNVS